MKALEMRRYEMLVRVREFGEAHQELFPEATAGHQAFAAVATAAAQLKQHAVARMSTRARGQRAKTVARQTLVRRLEAISRTARVIPGIPGLDERLSLPTRWTDQTIVIVGRLFARDAAPFAGQFIAHGMPPAFVADLTGLVDTFEQAIRGWELGQSGQAAARAGMAAALASGLSAARTLDVIVVNLFHADPVTLAVWARNRRVGYPQKKRRPGRGTVATPVAGLSRPA